AQNGTQIIVLPYHEADLCEAFDGMTTKSREAIDEISAGLKSQGYRSASFTAIMRNLKGRGGCDTQNPLKILSNVLTEAKCKYYMTVESSFEESSEGYYVNLNVSAYNAETREVVSYASAQSDKVSSTDARALTRNAWQKISSQITEYISLQPTTKKEEVVEKKVIIENGKIVAKLTSDVDINIPQAKNQNPDAIAVVIGNTNYTKTKPVKYALNDALAMKKYLIEAFGFKEANIFHIEDASKSDFELMFGTKEQQKGKLFNAVKRGKSDVFVFYSGHGAPGLKDKNAYFVPIECDPQYIEIGGYVTETFYRNLSIIPAKSITVVLDACFSGAELFQNISPIVIKPKGIMGIKNGNLLASSRDAEVSGWYNEKEHGLFTYFFLKAIQDKTADVDKNNKVTLNEIYRFVSDETEGVPFLARKLHGIDQNPVIQGTSVNKILVELNR
ncbi:MAG: caspase family protein, partial [Bacteroidetes bacterium]